MPHRGYVKIARKAYDEDPFWNERRIFSRWEAWEWLIQAAAYKDHERSLGNEVVPLVRGQLIASERYMAAKWSWSRKKVSVYLTRLIKRKMVVIKRDHQMSHLGSLITLCNYDRWQSLGASKGATKSTTKEPGGSQEGATLEPIEKAVNHGNTRKASDSQTDSFKEFCAFIQRKTDSKQVWNGRYAKIWNTYIAQYGVAVMIGLLLDREFENAEYAIAAFQALDDHPQRDHIQACCRERYHEAEKAGWNEDTPDSEAAQRLEEMTSQIGKRIS